VTAITPSFLSDHFAALVGVLSRELTMLERLAFKLTEAQLLVRADEFRFLGAMIDEIDAVEEDLGTFEVARAMLVADITLALGIRGGDLSLRELIPYAPTDLLDHLVGLLPWLAERIEELDGLRRDGSDVIVARIDELRLAVDDLQRRGQDQSGARRGYAGESAARAR